MTRANGRGSRWAGRVLTGLVVAFLIFDAVGKLLRVEPVVEASARLGLPAGLEAGIGLVLAVCTVLYAVPATAVLGAILLTGYLGGAAAIQLRAGAGAFPIGFAIAFGVLAWLGLVLRQPRLLAAIAPRRASSHREAGREAASLAVEP